MQIHHEKGVTKINQALDDAKKHAGIALEGVRRERIKDIETALSGLVAAYYSGANKPEESEKLQKALEKAQELMTDWGNLNSIREKEFFDYSEDNELVAMVRLFCQEIQEEKDAKRREENASVNI